MIEYLLSKIDAIMQQAMDRYGVDPAIFLVIYLISVPFFYYSLVRMMRAIARKRGNEVFVWSMIFLCTIVAPFIYVLFFGRHLPWWVYAIIALLIGQGIFSLIRKLRNAHNADPSAS